MKFLILISVLATTAYAANLKVTWGIPVPFINTNVLTDIPAELKNVKSNGWVETTRPDDGVLPELTLYCGADDVTFCVLYDNLGFAAGYQIALAKGNLSNVYTADLSTLGFVSWTESKTGLEYWTNQVYFVSEEFLSKSDSDRAAARKTNAIMPENSIWVRDLDGSLLLISGAETDIAKSVFTEQACIPTMGKHYYYKMDANADCNELFPWFPLLKDGKMIGLGFVVIGNLEVSNSRRMWFEKPAQQAVKTIISTGPQCIYDLAGSPGVTTMHVYFDYNPLTILWC